MNLKGRSLNNLFDLNIEEFNYILELAHQVKNEKKNNIFPKRLQNKNIALIFEKPSTRTRCSFIVAASDEGAHAVALSNTEIHLGEKESIEDTARVLGRIFDGIMFRGFKHKTLEMLIQHANVPVWNALTDLHHPTQALADIMTCQEYLGKLNRKKIVYLGNGDNNVTHSLIIASCMLGMHIVICCPDSFQPDKEIIQQSIQIAKKTNGTISVLSNPLEAVKNADCIYTDVWISMGDENKGNNEEKCKQLLPYQVNKKLMLATKNSECFVLHCLPAYKNMEISCDVFEENNKFIFDLAENRMHSIKAIMLATLIN
ncbi:ornithine carbamoyltransferase [Pigmentibacter ruber]|uniref:ornithine carbamoyltransferase n=1 Tax=Pigmentibacter ruber TaxID=2683196 RepID=UPI00131B638F|nr:ornithine carbamoyltransferase [Pigmentibacter ruber]